MTKQSRDLPIIAKICQNERVIKNLKIISKLKYGKTKKDLG